MKPLWMNWALESNDKNDHYSVYVIELSKLVLNEPKFRKANPNYKHLSPCVYVGMSGLDPIERFAKHKSGIKSNIYAQRFGMRLLPNLYAKYNPMSFDDAKIKEKELAEELRGRGFAVWMA